MNTLTNLFFSNKDILIYFIWFPLLTLFYEVTNRIWFNKKPIVFEINLDKKIPLIPWTVYIYNLWFPLYIGIFFLFAFIDRGIFFHMLYLNIISQVISNLFFIFFQNEVPQNYLIKRDGITNKILFITKKADNPYNGFPSIHILTCLICILGILYIPILFIVKFLLILFLVLIIISTFTTKQHVLLDTVGSIFALIFSQILYLLFI